jgi:type IV secretory pathway VirB6-like protein
MKINLILLFLLVLSCGCSTSDRGCRSGDNFDGNSTEIESKFDVGDPYYLNDSGAQFTENYSLIKWQDTGFVTNGKKIVIDIDGRWSPWGRDSMAEEYFDVDEFGVGVVKYKTIENVCKNYLTKSIPIPGVATSEIGRYLTITQPDRNSGGYPCWISNGIGLYLLFRDSSDPRPNSSLIANESPVSGTIHLNDIMNETSNRFIIDPKDIKSSDGLQVFPNGEIKQGVEIWAKIYDRYYPDNYGSYRLNFIEGVFKTQKNPIFESCYNYIMKDIIGTSKSIFIAITNDIKFKAAVNTILILFITITGILFVLGFIQMTAFEVFVRVFKVGIIAVLLNPGSWEFFYDYIFKLYLEGVIEMSSIIISGDKLDQSKPMAFLDDLSSKVLNPYITNRMAALINANLILGLLWCFVISLILFFFSVMLVISFASFIISMILLYFITMLFPIFIIFILFNFTKSYFQQWVDAILGYSMQVILTFVSLAFMAGIVQIQMQKILGFRMCVAATMHLNPFSDASGSDTDSSPLTIKQWAPGENDWYSPITFWGIVIPGLNIYELFIKVHYKFDYSIERFLVPPEYKDYRYRYRSLPFLEPDENYSGAYSQEISQCQLRKNKENCHPDKVFPNGIDQEEHKQIARMMFPPENNSYEFVSFIDLLALIVLIFISWRINIDVIPALSYTIAILQKDYIPPEMFGMTSMQNFQNNILNSLQRMSQNDNVVIARIGQVAFGVLNTDGLFSTMVTLRDKIGKSDRYNKILEKMGLNDLDEKIFGKKINGLSDFYQLTAAEREMIMGQRFKDEEGNVLFKGSDVMIDKDGNELRIELDSNNKTIYKDKNGNVYRPELEPQLDENGRQKFNDKGDKLYNIKQDADGKEIYKDQFGNKFDKSSIQSLKDVYRDENGNIIYSREVDRDGKTISFRKNGAIFNQNYMEHLETIDKSAKVAFMEGGLTGLATYGLEKNEITKDMLDTARSVVNPVKDILTDDNGRVGRFIGQVGNAVSDSIGIASEKRSIWSESENVENLRLMHHWQDTIGAHLDLAEAKFDKFGAHALGKALDPTHSTAKDLFGGYDFANPFVKDEDGERHLFEKKEGLIGNLANAFAGDAINQWAIEHGYTKDGEKVFENQETVGGALDKFFHEDERSMFTGSYNRIADMGYDEYIKAIDASWNSRVDTRGIGNESKDKEKIYNSIDEKNSLNSKNEEGESNNSNSQELSSNTSGDTYKNMNQADESNILSKSEPEIKTNKMNNSNDLSDVSDREFKDIINITQNINNDQSINQKDNSTVLTNTNVDEELKQNVMVDTYQNMNQVDESNILSKSEPEIKEEKTMNMEDFEKQQKEMEDRMDFMKKLHETKEENPSDSKNDNSSGGGYGGSVGSSESYMQNSNNTGSTSDSSKSDDNRIESKPNENKSSSKEKPEVKKIDEVQDNEAEKEQEKEKKEESKSDTDNKYEEDKLAEEAEEKRLEQINRIQNRVDELSSKISLSKKEEEELQNLVNQLNVLKD